jgi:nucleotide-binding universal stress UspA family protein/sporulation protein YlmC with PRC-barrel domain
LRILVPLDDTLPSQRGLAYAQALASATHGTLRLIRATDAEDETSFNSLDRIAERLNEAGVAVEWSVFSGVDGQTAIRDVERAWLPDLIVLATTKASGFDRWLNGSVAEAVVKSAHVPVLLVPRDWNRTLVARGPARILIALDGSRSAERALQVATVLANRISADLVLFRAIQAEHDRTATNEYLQQIASATEPLLDRREVIQRVVMGRDSTSAAILNAAIDLDIDAVAMSTRGHGSARPHLMGGTTTAVVDQSQVPLLLIGPNVLPDRIMVQIKLRAAVHTADTRRIGEVHHVIVDLAQQAIVGVVVVGRTALSRDVLVPFDVVESASGGDVHLLLSHEQTEALPDFAYNEFNTPPSTWTSVNPVGHRERLTPAQRDISTETEVEADNGIIGHVEQVDADPESGQLTALWIRGAQGRRRRIPANWLRRSDTDRNLHVARAKAEIEARWLARLDLAVNSRRMHLLRAVSL